jgi:predicted AAA+ superfamily ATPase
LFDARGTGKSTLLRQLFLQENCLWLDLLDPEQETRFALNPNELTNLVLALSPKTTHVIIDEVQKVPKLLDVVHALCEKTKKSFMSLGGMGKHPRLKANTLV